MLSGFFRTSTDDLASSNAFSLNEFKAFQILMNVMKKKLKMIAQSASSILYLPKHYPDSHQNHHLSFKIQFQISSSSQTRLSILSIRRLQLDEQHGRSFSSRISRRFA